jgi:hypothetical protein
MEDERLDPLRHRQLRGETEERDDDEGPEHDVDRVVQRGAAVQLRVDDAAEQRDADGAAE